VVDVAWRGILLFGLDGEKVGLVDDYVVVHCNVCGRLTSMSLLVVVG